MKKKSIITNRQFQHLNYTNARLAWKLLLDNGKGRGHEIIEEKRKHFTIHVR